MTRTTHLARGATIKVHNKNESILTMRFMSVEKPYCEVLCVLNKLLCTDLSTNRTSCVDGISTIMDGLDFYY